jgi:predicted metal-dependent phosphoesterase TrpH
MPRVYDLHTHSQYSDGSLTPAELVARAAASGVEVLALTDHDSTEGLAAAAAAARIHGLVLVPGVEISVTWDKRTVHVVGLNIDSAQPSLQQGLARLRAFREWRAEEIGRRLAKAGIEDATAGARRHARQGLVSRTHFAHFLVETGRAPDVRRVFKKFLVHGKPGHVPGEWATLVEAVGWIRAAGGQAVLAHPARYQLTGSRLKKLLNEFREAGGEGIEVVCGSHSRDDAFRFGHLAQAHGLLASSGSDYHGPENGYFDLGPLPPLPEGCTPVWSLWQERGARVEGRPDTASDTRTLSLAPRS